MATDVGEDLGLETELADSLAVRTRLFAGGRRRELDVLDTERIKSFGDGDLGLGVKESVGELLVGRTLLGDCQPLSPLPPNSARASGHTTRLQLPPVARPEQQHPSEHPHRAPLGGIYIRVPTRSGLPPRRVP